MKIFSSHNKYLCIISCSLLVALSSTSIPLMANTSSNQVFDMASSTNSQCPCKRPFRRFTAAMQLLKKEGLVSSTDIKNIYDALMKIPPETLEKVEDKDLSAAQALYNDKVLTEEQYKKISSFLKENPPRKP